MTEDHSNGAIGRRKQVLIMARHTVDVLSVRIEEKIRYGVVRD